MTTSRHEPRPAQTGTTDARAAASGPTLERVRHAPSVPHAFDAVADTWPNRSAVEWDTGRWTYRDLQEASRQVERRLRSEGVSPGAAVAVLGDRSAETCATMLGILRAGAAYVPVDANLPAVRVRAMLDTAGVTLAVRPGVLRTRGGVGGWGFCPPAGGSRGGRGGGGGARTPPRGSTSWTSHRTSPGRTTYRTAHRTVPGRTAPGNRATGSRPPGSRGTPAATSRPTSTARRT